MKKKFSRGFSDELKTYITIRPKEWVLKDCEQSKN